MINLNLQDLFSGAVEIRLLEKPSKSAVNKAYLNTM